MDHRVSHEPEGLLGGRALFALRVVVGLAALAAIAWGALALPVQEGHAAIVSRFGEPVAVHTEAGLHARLPWPIDRAEQVDLRLQVFDSGHSEMLTRDKKNLLLNSYVVWRVSDPLRFYTAVGGVDAAEEKLDGLVLNAAIGVMGRHDLAALVSTDPSLLQLDAIEAELLEATSPLAAEQYGIAIQQLGFRRISLPEENVAYVFKQMRAERLQHAARYRAEGDQEASRIRSETDLEAARIRAEAAEKAAKVTGDAEAEAASIYAEAHRMDPELYRFTRSLESLETIVGDQTTVILRTDAAPFELLVEGSSGR